MMEEYKLFLERGRSDYYHDGLTVDADQNQSYCEPDEIAQPKGRRTTNLPKIQ